MKPIVRIRDVGKRYQIGAKPRYRTLRESVVDSFTGALATLKHLPSRTRGVAGNGQNNHIWALKNVDLDIMPGEVLGVIGRNGAGKSTLLKILSRITEPTVGRIDLYGRVGSLLEVGTGFHPELTGRENIFLSAAILGMGRSEIERKFDEIVAFSEIEQFLDTPVKHYSSGMYVRLAFAVAAHLEPEILLVDEVLAVGDVAFQKKCLGKMGEVARRGRTVIFVSHNMGATQQLTSRSMLLHRGTVEFVGETSKVIEKYLKSATDLGTQTYDAAHQGRRIPGLSRVVEFVRLDLGGHLNGMIEADRDLVVTVTLKASVDVPKFRLSMTVFAPDARPVGNTFGSENLSIGQGKHSKFEFRLQNHHLAPGSYYCAMGVGIGNHLTDRTEFDVILDVLHFEVLAPEGDNGTRAYWPSGWGNVCFDPAATREISPDLAVLPRP
jgi:lipopolysaccharide transport system ATP-binding protein